LASRFLFHRDRGRTPQIEIHEGRQQKSSLVANFEEVFGLPYHKMTFAKYRGLMDSDDDVIQDIIEAYISEGTGDSGLWPAFAAAIKDRVAFLEKGKAEGKTDSEDVLDDGTFYLFFRHIFFCLISTFPFLLSLPPRLFRTLLFLLNLPLEADRSLLSKSTGFLRVTPSFVLCILLHYLG
jgi:hypothetical protein